MDMSAVAARGLVLLGCGKMGSAMLTGWLRDGLDPHAVWIIDPHPSEWVLGLEGVHLNTSPPESPAVVLIAVKPQMMDRALPMIAPMGNGATLFVSVAAGTTIARYESVLGADTPIVRAMPNTPAAIGMGITALVGNAHADAAALAMAEGLLGAIGETVRLDREDLMDAVTAVSGSGPAYVFHLIETMAAAGAEEGLPPDLALRLAKATVAGAGTLAASADEDPGQLRVDVTSPGGTTAAALDVLMDAEAGFPALLRKAVTAAAARGRELGQ